jgi:hypothetical protein
LADDEWLRAEELAHCPERAAEYDAAAPRSVCARRTAGASAVPAGRGWWRRRHPRVAPLGSCWRRRPRCWRVLLWWGGPPCTAGRCTGRSGSLSWVSGRLGSRTGSGTHGVWLSAWGRQPRSWTPPRTARGLPVRTGGCCSASARPQASFSFSGTPVMGRGPAGRARGPSSP